MRERKPLEQRDYLKALGGTVRCLDLLIGPGNQYRERLKRRLAEIDLILNDVDEKTHKEWDIWLNDGPRQKAAGKELPPKSANATQEKALQP